MFGGPPARREAGPLKAEIRAPKRPPPTRGDGRPQNSRGARENHRHPGTPPGAEPERVPGTPPPKGRGVPRAEDERAFPGWAQPMPKTEGRLGRRLTQGGDARRTTGERPTPGIE